MTTVSRGLLAVSERSAPGIHAAPWDERLERRMAELRHPGLRDHAWRELRELCLTLGHGGSDHLGRRVFSDAGKSDCRYVARIAFGARRGSELSDRQWSLLRASLRRIFQELEGGAP